MSLDMINKSLNEIFMKVANDEKLIQLISYDGESPYTQEVELPAHKYIRTKMRNDLGNLEFNKDRRVFPFPFVPDVQTNVCTQLRIYFPEITSSKRVLFNENLIIDIVMHNTLWEIYNEDGDKLSRPIEILNRITDLFDDKPLTTIGHVQIKRCRIANYNQSFNGYQIIAEMKTLK